MFSILNLMLFQWEGPLPKAGVSEQLFNIHELKKTMFSSSNAANVSKPYFSLAGILN